MSVSHKKLIASQPSTSRHLYYLAYLKLKKISKLINALPKVIKFVSTAYWPAKI